MSDVRGWLEAIGLAQYADAFEANDIDMDLLRQIDDQALRDLGMSSDVEEMLKKSRALIWNQRLRRTHT